MEGRRWVLRGYDSGVFRGVFCFFAGSIFIFCSFFLWFCMVCFFSYIRKVEVIGLFTVSRMI